MPLLPLTLTKKTANWTQEPLIGWFRPVLQMFDIFFHFCCIKLPGFHIVHYIRCDLSRLCLVKVYSMFYRRCYRKQPCLFFHWAHKRLCSMSFLSSTVILLFLSHYQPYSLLFTWHSLQCVSVHTLWDLWSDSFLIVKHILWVLTNSFSCFPPSKSLTVNARGMKDFFLS